MADARARAGQFVVGWSDGRRVWRCAVCGSTGPWSRETRLLLLGRPTLVYGTYRRDEYVVCSARCSSKMLGASDPDSVPLEELWDKMSRTDRIRFARTRWGAADGRQQVEPGRLVDLGLVRREFVRRNVVWALTDRGEALQAWRRESRRRSQ